MPRNEPRTIPYDFHVVEIDGWVWLFDDSSRTLYCSPERLVYCEPLYPVMPEGEEWEGDGYPDPAYFSERTVGKRTTIRVPLHEEYIQPDIDEATAWDDAREEANANCLI